MKKIFIVIFLLFIVIVGIRWIHLSNLSETSTIAMSYLKNEGFFVLYHDGDYGPYTITTDNITEKPYSDYLKVQNKDPEFYVNKELHHEFFYVSNHPLNKVFGLGSTFVAVIMDGEEIVGAFSIKNGMVYSLHGK